MERNRIRAITLHQPWASLVAYSLKRFETRSWPTKHRGSLAIHAAKRPAQRGEVSGIIMDALMSVGFYHLDDLPLGCVVAIANLVDCEPTEEVLRRTFFKEIEGTEYYFGDYSPGRFAWQLDSIIRTSHIPAKGKQGFWWWEPPVKYVLPSDYQGALDVYGG